MTTTPAPQPVWTCLECSDAGNGDREAERHTAKTGHATSTHWGRT